MAYGRSSTSLIIFSVSGYGISVCVKDETVLILKLQVCV